MRYSPVIGLEIHIELKTQTKMFCDCLRDSSERHANVNICPICTAHPGVLPVINKKAVESVLKLGLALNTEIAKFSKFDRKNYFYPDLPKGYQISQYDEPLCKGGYLEIFNKDSRDNISETFAKKIRVRRIHLEEDTGTLSHIDFKNDNYSLVNFNRAGVPLMELVTEPDIKSAKEAVEFSKELQMILRYLEISEADMEKGQLRIEANISLSKDAGKCGTDIGLCQGGLCQSANCPSQPTLTLGTKVEVKNLNSFRAVEQAIEYEIERQAEILDGGKAVIQETRGWDDKKLVTVSQRLKEEAQDYRYFPEPDLPLLDLTSFDVNQFKKEIPELPAEKRTRFHKEYGLTYEQIEILIEDRLSAKYFEEAASELKSQISGVEYPLLFNYFTTDLRGLMKERQVGIKELKITPENFAELIALIIEGKVSSRAAKDILLKMFDTSADPSQILEQENLGQISDKDQLESVVKRIVEANPQAAADYRKGKTNTLQFLIGKAMAELKSRGNPEVLKTIFKEFLKGG